MNVITILIDSLNRHLLEAYGCQTVATPNLKRFSERATVFDQHFIGSAPCMPARRELFTGRQEFLWRPWGHLEPFDDPISREAKRAGAVTAMITDHYHYWENGAHGYFEEFDQVEFLRGHELDMASTAKPGEVPAWAKAIDRWRPGWGTRYYQNVRDYKTEEDFHSPRVMQSAANWLDANHDHEKFFLWLESFDAHEPFHIPEPYRSMYTADLNPEYTCWPPYQNSAELAKFLEAATPEHLDYIRAEYAGKVTMLDNWLGRVFDQLDQHDLWKNTMVIVTTDHGHDLAYHEQFGKQWPHYESHANIPLMIWHPEQQDRGRRIDAMTCAVDIYPTILEALGHTNIQSPNGRSLMPLVKGGTNRHRDWVLYGTYGAGATISTRETTLSQGSRADVPICAYNCLLRGRGPEYAQAEAGKYIPGVDLPMWRVQHRSSDLPSYLWDRNAPGLEPENLIDQRPEETRKMRALLKQALDEVGCPPEQYDRLALRA